MNILIDTHLLIWSMSASEKLSAQAKKYLTQADMVYVSAASLWEISIKNKIGKLEVNVLELIAQMNKINIQQLPINWGHAILTQDLPLYHRDPFDRLLVAQAISEPLILLTNDEVLAQYSELVCYVP